MATVSLTPDRFLLVKFEADAVRDVIARTADRLGLTSETITVDVDESVSLARTTIVSVDPIHLRIESGALENTKRLRTFGEVETEREVARLLLKVIDRRSPSFADAPTDDKLSLQQAIAWDAYAAGRIERLGIPAQQDRRRYAFRNRHGFSDAVDAEFDQLWMAEGLGWPDLVAICDRTAALRTT
jgi:hypothetical protein